MGTTLNPNILFIFSPTPNLQGNTVEGIDTFGNMTFGNTYFAPALFSVTEYYQFIQNPENLTVQSPKQTNNTLTTLEAGSIRNRPLLDNEVRIMKWSEASYALYVALRQFSNRDSLGNIPTTYFWDGTVKEFQGAAIQVIDVFGQPNVAKATWNIELQFKPITNFDY